MVEGQQYICGKSRRTQIQSVFSKNVRDSDVCSLKLMCSDLCVSDFFFLEQKVFEAYQTRARVQDSEL